MNRNTCSQTSGIETSQYGWTSAQPEQSHECLLPAVVKHLRSVSNGRPLNILDLGCGNGSLTAQIASLGHSITGVDVSEDGIRVASCEFPHLRFRVASVYDEEIADQGTGYDVILSLEVIEHLFYPKRLFVQARRLLKPTGHLVLSTPYHGYAKNLALSVFGAWDRHFGVERDGGHIKFFSNATLAAMATDAGLKVIGFTGAGRIPYLWKSTILLAQK